MPRMAGRREGDWRMNIWEKKKDRERESKRAVLTLSGLIDWLATLDQTTMHQSLSASQSRQAWGKKKKRKKKTCTLYGFSSRVLALTSATTADLLLLAGRSQINVQYTLFVIKKIMRYQPAKAKKIYDVLWQQEIWNMFPAKQLLWGHN